MSEFDRAWIHGVLPLWKIFSAHDVHSWHIVFPMATINQTVRQCKEALAQYYGKRLQGVILYGSMAQGDATSASDIDLLVLLSPPLDYFTELRCIIDVLYPIQLESDQLVSAKPASVDDYNLGAISLYRNAQREGVVV